MNHQVVIENHSFNPSTITIAVGDTVTWQNRDPVRHTATRTDAPPFDTGLIAPGTASSPIDFTTQTGTQGIDYFCRPHPFMQGIIIVLPQTV
jgi:plastocyanin